MMHGTLFIISAPSGTGKTTVANVVVEQLKNKCRLERAITCTSRLPRQGEVHGRDYFFMSPQEFEQKIKEDFFLEWSTAYGTYYGSPKSMLAQLEQGTSLICILDRAGARAMCAHVKDPVSIWLTCDIKTLEQRLRKRGANAESDMRKRLALAEQELAAEEDEDWYTHHVLSEHPDKTAAQLAQIIRDRLTPELSC